MARNLRHRGPERQQTRRRPASEAPRCTFHQFLKFTEQRLRKEPSRLVFQEIDAPLITAFLDHLERHQGLSTRSRNLRLTALRSFFRFAAFEAPTHSAHIQRVLAISSKRFTRTLVQFSHTCRSRCLANRSGSAHMVWPAWSRLLLLAVQTGLRLSEMTGLKRQDIILGAGAHVRLIGKGRKERCTPIARSTLAVLRAWLREPQRGDEQVLFPNAKGERLSIHGVQYLLDKHRVTASNLCPFRWNTNASPCTAWGTPMGMDLLQAGVDRSVIALWLGHEHVETTQIYLEATLVPDDLNAFVMFETLNDRGLKTPQADLLSSSFVIGCKWNAAGGWKLQPPIKPLFTD
jgi:site-specific recombinase XerD